MIYGVTTGYGCRQLTSPSVLLIDSQSHLTHFIHVTYYTYIVCLPGFQYTLFLVFNCLTYTRVNIQLMMIIYDVYVEKFTVFLFSR